MIQRVDRGPCLGYPELRMGPTNTLRKEKVKISNPVWHSGQNRATCPEITRIGTARVPVWRESECYWYGLHVPVYGG